MQSKGLIKLVAILLALACIWQLLFTPATWYHESKAEEAGSAAVADAGEVSDSAKAEIYKAASQEYLQNVNWCSYSYKDIKAKEISLGLDLKGGMSVTLQVQLDEFVKELAGSKGNDVTLAAAIAAAKETSTKNDEDFLDAFAAAWADKTINAEGKSLATAFDASTQLDKYDIAKNASDATVIGYIRKEAEDAIDNSAKVTAQRVGNLGLANPTVQLLSPKSKGRILVELPGVKDRERVENLLKATAILEFRPTFAAKEVLNDLKGVANEIESEDQEISNIFIGWKRDDVLPLSEDGACIGYVTENNVQKALDFIAVAKAQSEDLEEEFEALASAKPIELADYGAEMAAKVAEAYPNTDIYEIVALKPAALNGDAVTDARVTYPSTGKANPAVSMSMDAKGAEAWANITRTVYEGRSGKQVAIVLDNKVYSYPRVNGVIEGGNSEITGNFTVEEATDLVNTLKSGKLSAPSEVVSEEIVGPTLGAKSINAGLISFLIAFCLILIYMVFFYQGAGLVADFALIVNVLFLVGTLVSFGAVLTLPGIAGLVLTLGMAVDANVIIYERIKEELAAGKGLSKAVADGYKNAYSAIIDGQVTTILTGIVLAVFGSGPVQGFATTLIIGIVTSVITSIFITRLVFEGRIKHGRSISFDNKLTRNFLKNTKVDFLGKKKWSYIISGALIVVAVASIFTKGFTYGVDFTGGRTYIVKMDTAVEAEQISKTLTAEFNSSVEVKQYGEANQMRITIQDQAAVESSEANEAVATDNTAYSTKLLSALAEYNPEIDQESVVGPSIADETKTSAIIAVLIALFVIFAYIAVRFKGWTWGLGGVVSLAHTAIIVIGFFSLFSGILPFNLDVDQTFIAAILTIIGYAINDNVVIFDRIREFKLAHPKADLKDNMNRALNSTLTRTVNTSVSTLVVMLAIAIFGGESIRGLAVALILGICLGTYASIMIGTPVMYDATKWNEKRKAKKAE